MSKQKMNVYTSVYPLDNGSIVKGGNVTARNWNEAQCILDITGRDGHSIDGLLVSELPEDLTAAPAKFLEPSFRLHRLSHSHTCPIIDEAYDKLEARVNELVKTPNTRRKLMAAFKEEFESVRQSNSSIRSAAKTFVKKKSIVHDLSRLSISCRYKWRAMKLRFKRRKNE